MNELTDEILFQRFKQGSHPAFEELYRRYGQRLYAYFLKMFNMDRQKAGDFTQDLFIKLIDNKDRFDPGKRFKPWVFTIATNMCRTEFRKQPNVELDDVTMAVSHESNLHDDRIFKDMLRKCVHELSYSHKVVFILRHQHQLSVKEVATIVGCSEGTVKSRLYYATNKLAKRLLEFAPDSRSNSKFK